MSPDEGLFLFRSSYAIRHPSGCGMWVVPPDAAAPVFAPVFPPGSACGPLLVRRLALARPPPYDAPCVPPGSGLLLPRRAPPCGARIDEKASAASGAAGQEAFSASTNLCHRFADVDTFHQPRARAPGCQSGGSNLFLGSAFRA